MITAPISPDEYESFREFLEDASGIVLGDNKHYLITSRITRLMAELSIPSFSDLLARAQEDSRLRQRIMDAMTTNETSWFRDSYPYEFLTEKFYPERVRQSGKDPIRIWSAACSTGQEPYSVGITTREFLLKNPGLMSADNIQIWGTDISSKALQHARAGLYDDVALSRGMSAELRKRYFRQEDNQWRVSDDIKKRVNFQELNLKTGFASLGKFDIIFCRNVLIYFSPDLKADIMYRMAQALKPNGYLILGGSETISGYSEDFDIMRWKSVGVVYQLKPGKKKFGFG
ncbi:MAG: protein-glutamate O-methyltransferase CheR [Gammaproteobacteria bacterium]